jgi:hypothetical protein
MRATAILVFGQELCFQRVGAQIQGSVKPQHAAWFSGFAGGYGLHDSTNHF